jgi:hypothetical protein
VIEADERSMTDPQGFLNLIDSDANSKDDVKVPDSDLGREIEKAFEDGKDLLVTIVAAMGRSSSSLYRTLPGHQPQPVCTKSDKLTCR